MCSTRQQLRQVQAAKASQAAQWLRTESSMAWARYSHLALDRPASDRRPSRVIYTCHLAGWSRGGVGGWWAAIGMRRPIQRDAGRQAKVDSGGGPEHDTGNTDIHDLPGAVHSPQRRAPKQAAQLTSASCCRTARASCQ